MVKQFNLNKFKNKNAISGLIAVILLVVVCVALIVIILSWGKGFTNDSLDGDIVDTYKRSTELSGIIKSKQVIGNNVFIENISPNKNIEIIGYKINTSSITHDLLNTYVPLDENITLNYGTTQKLELPLPSDKKVMVDLYTSNNEIISVKFNNIQAITTFAELLSLGLDSAESYGTSSYQTSDGGYVILGILDSGNNYDMALFKLDSSGNQDWNYTYDSGSSDYSTAVISTSDGGYGILGKISNGVNYDDIILLKVDSSGNFDWNYTYDGGSYDFSTFLISTSDGGYGILGRTHNGSDNDILLLKVNSSGSYDWNYTYDGGGNDYPTVIISTSDGGYGILGKVYNDFDRDILLLKIDSSGNYDWNYTYDGGNHDYSTSLISTSDGGYGILGYTHNGSNDDIILFKLDSSGNQDWNYTYDSGSSDYSTAVISTSDGGYGILGKISNGVNYDDIILFKLDSTGSYDWNYTFDGGINDYSVSLISTDDGGYVILGITDQYPTWWTGNEDFSMNILLLKVDASGNLVSSNNLGGNSLNSENGQNFFNQTVDGGFIFTLWTGGYGSYEASTEILVVKTDSEGNCPQIRDLPVSEAPGEL